METPARNLQKLICGRFVHTKRRVSVAAPSRNRLAQYARLLPAAIMVEIYR